MIVEFLLWRMFVVILTHMIVLTDAHLAMGMLELSSLSHLFIPKGIALKGFCFIGGCFGILCLRELACRTMNKLTCDLNYVNAYGSMIPCMFPTL